MNRRIQKGRFHSIAQNNSIWKKLLLFLLIVSSCVGLPPGFPENGNLTPHFTDSVDEVSKNQTVSRFKEISTLGQSSIFDASMSPNGQIIAVAARNGLYLHDSISFEITAQIASANEAIKEISWSGDSTYLSGLGAQQSLMIWDVEENRLVSNIQDVPNSIGITSVSPDGKMIAGRDYNKNAIFIWDVKSGELIHELWGDREFMYMNQLVWSPDGNLLASSDTWRPGSEINGGLPDSTLYIWDPNGGKLLRKINAGDTAIYSIAWSPDGKRISISNSNSLIIHDVEKDGQKTILEELEYTILGMDWSPDASHIVYGGTDFTIREIDSSNGMVTKELVDNIGKLEDISYYPNGLTIFSVYNNGWVRIWMETGYFDLYSPVKQMGSISSIGWGYDESFLVVGSFSKSEIFVWNLLEDKLEFTLGNIGEWVESLDVSPNGEL